MSLRTNSGRFPELSRQALADRVLGKSLAGVEEVMPRVRRASIDELGDFGRWQRRAAGIRDRVLDNLDRCLRDFEQRVTGAGGHVHHARTADDACRIVAELCGQAGARRIAKSKSMVTEEIELNTALERAGYRVTETDLGEYIIQLRGERPSHILAPSLHVTLEQVADAFRARHDFDPDRDLGDASALLNEARQVLRDEFLSADVGITGANFLVAETGAAVIVTNEGNADLTANLPDTHIVVTGVEKLVADLDDLGVLLRLLARSAVGERLSNYTTFVHGPRQPEETSGPANYHVVLVDNGRRELLGTEFREMLRCIRCSACINHCPVYTSIGGHAYGSVYSGPMGAVLTPALAGIGATAHLPHASTLCGRCASVCPVDIALPRLLRSWRRRARDLGSGSASQRVALRAWCRLGRHPLLYRGLLRIASLALRGISVPGEAGMRWVRRLPFAGRSWSRHRDLRSPNGRTFQSEWRRRRGP